MPRRRFYIILAVLLLVEILCALEQSMVTSVLPTVVRQFKDVSLAGWLVSAFGLATAATAAIGGRLGDLFGRQRMLIVVAAICVAGSLISALAPSLPWIIFGRAVQGVSGAILPLCYGIIRDIAGRGRAAFWIGVLAGGYSFSAIFGYILGGVFADMGSWASIFILTAVVSAVSIPLLFLFVPNLPGVAQDRRIDWLGAALFAPGVAAVLFGVTMAIHWTWHSPRTWGLVGGGLAVIAFWAWYEARHEDPLINVRLLRNRKILCGNLCTVFAHAGILNLPLVFLMFLQQNPAVSGAGLGVSATLAGVLKIPSNLSGLVASPYAGWLAGKHGSRWAVCLGGVVGVAAWVGMEQLHDSIWQVAFWGVWCAAASNILLAALPNMVLEGTPRARSSETTGLAATVRGLSTAIGAQLIAIVLASSTVLDPKTGAHLPTQTAYNAVFLLIALGGFVCAGVALMAGRRRAELGEEV